LQHGSNKTDFASHARAPIRKFDGGRVGKKGGPHFRPEVEVDILTVETAGQQTRFSLFGASLWPDGRRQRARITGGLRQWASRVRAGIWENSNGTAGIKFELCSENRQTRSILQRKTFAITAEPCSLPYALDLNGVGAPLASDRLRS
jgi:hypothetical protein